MHSAKSDSEEICHRYCCEDIFDGSGPNKQAIELFFISDTPHIIKRMRNCWYYSRTSAPWPHRMMQKGGIAIDWSHLIEVYNYDSQQCRLHITKLRREHIFLNSSSLMKTKLATQVFNIINLNIMKEQVPSSGDWVFLHDILLLVRFRFFKKLKHSKTCLGPQQ